MNSSRNQIEAILESVLALDTAAERMEYLDRICTNPEMRREVELKLHQWSGAEPPVAQETIKVDFVDQGTPSDHDQNLGQTLDEKYRLEKLLGRGGMGAVYLATHLGTGRFVAVKLITPQYMRNEEFVERFKREARAAGKLRHPNIVDVTDFGFSEGIAYLVMEYLDGCSLRDVLAEEKSLPVDWVVDIMEQICSAVHEAHRQGIVHRDLKPDNIWLEPNRLGGYRAKVLDFGIAKLAEATGGPSPLPDDAESTNTNRTMLVTPLTQTAIEVISQQQKTPHTPGVIRESQTPIPEQAVVKVPTEQLTRVGAIMGTPVFMSPEQCRGEESLDARSDIYSLGVIAYQMLAGTPPFAGDPLDIIQAHKDQKPAHLNAHNRKVPRKIADVILSALEKDPSARPQTALAFANSLRANADGLGVLYRRAFAFYSEYFPKMIALSLLAHLPVIAVMLLTIGVRLSDPITSQGLRVGVEISLGVLKTTATFLTASTIGGVIAIIVTQLAVAPMRRVELEGAFAILRRRVKPFLKTGLMASVRIFIGFLMLGIPGLLNFARYSMWAPVALMEGLEKKPALQRSRALAARSKKTVMIVSIIQISFSVVAERLMGKLMGLAPDPKGNAQMNVLAELVSLTSILVLPLLSIVPALLYLKMRQFGGETLNEVMAQVENADTRRKWQQRMRSRLMG